MLYKILMAQLPGRKDDAQKLASEVEAGGRVVFVGIR